MGDFHSMQTSEVKVFKKYTLTVWNWLATISHKIDASELWALDGRILPSWELLYVQLLMLLYFSAHPVTKNTRPSYLLSWHVSYLFSVLATFCSFVNHDTPSIDNWFWKQPLPSGLTATLHNFVMQSWTFWTIIKRLGQKWTHLGLEAIRVNINNTMTGGAGISVGASLAEKKCALGRASQDLTPFTVPWAGIVGWTRFRIHDFGCTFPKPKRTSR